MLPFVLKRSQRTVSKYRLLCTVLIFIAFFGTCFYYYNINNYNRPYIFNLSAYKDGLHDLKGLDFFKWIKIKDSLEQGQSTESKSSSTEVTETPKISTSTHMDLKNVSQNASYEIENFTTMSSLPLSTGYDSEFIVYTNTCQIVNMDPFDASVRALIEPQHPINCSSDYPNLTYSDLERIYFNEAALKRLKAPITRTGFRCCYRVLLRRIPSRDDEDVIINPICKPFRHGEAIPHEFIKVECYVKKELVYRNFHSFVKLKLDVEQRCQRLLKRFNQYSILIIGIDAVSRLNAHRQIPKTMAFLKDVMGAIEMYGYTKVGDNTFPNLVPFLMGITEEELLEYHWNKSFPLDNAPLIWKKFVQAGWRTQYSEDTYKISTFNYVKKGFYVQPTDYYLRPFMVAYESELGRRHVLNCKQCVGPISETEAVLHWTGAFASVFKALPYFSMSWINSLSHDYLNTIAMADDIYYNFFRNLFHNKMLENSVVILMSDHGLRWGEIRDTYSGWLEDRLPLMMIAMPLAFRRRHPKLMTNIHINSKRLTTPFDMHATLLNFVNFNGNARQPDEKIFHPEIRRAAVGRGLTLFGEIPEERTCKDASIDLQWCACSPSLPIHSNHSNILKIAEFLVSEINNLTKPHRKICEKLNLTKVLEGSLRKTLGASYNNAKNVLNYDVKFETAPGLALFEGTVRHNLTAGTKEVLGDISRLNLYGKQSHCVNDTLLKKFCFCKGFA